MVEDLAKRLVSTSGAQAHEGCRYAMKKCVIITCTRWDVPSDASTFPAWHFFRTGGDVFNFQIWAEGAQESVHNNIHSIKCDFPQGNTGVISKLRFACGCPPDVSDFPVEFVQACEESELIFMQFGGGGDIENYVLRKWGDKTILHLTDNLVLYYLRAWSWRYAFRAYLCQLHTARLISKGIVFVSESDRKLYSVMFPWKKHLVYALPLGVDTSKFYPKYSKLSSNERTFKLLFTGDLGYEPNTLACRYIVHHIMPKLPEDVVMVFGGRNPPEFLSSAALSHSRIKVTGYIDDISEIYRDCDCFLAPIFRGAGMQNKLLEAAASGLPCITTPICAKAFPKLPPNFLIAKKAIDIIRLILELKDNRILVKQLGGEGREFVEKYHSWEARTDALINIAGL